MDVTTTPAITHQNVRLCRGAHRSPADGACVMELVSMLAGERFTDRPQTACPVIGAFLRAYNDVVGDASRQDLLACASTVVASRRPAYEALRVQRCVDEAIAAYEDTPSWRRRLEGDHRLMVVLAVADVPLDRAGLDRLGYQLARLMRCARHGRRRALALVDDLSAMGAGPRVEVEATGLRVLVRD
jgi:hypothetical protein